MKIIAFRFFFIYFLLNITPWFWFAGILGIPFLNEFYARGDQWVVEWTNTHIIHVKDTLNSNGGGSGDTSYAWAQFYTYLLLSVMGSLVWSLIDRRKTIPRTLDFILKTTVRYGVIMNAFAYGIIKLFALQMAFPNLHLLSTPLGDYLPMRLSWIFLGYSTPYQMFSGIMEIIVGVLLLNRKTVTLGSLMGVAVFMHVFLLNLSYDIPVKLNSMLLVIYCMFLVSYDWRRIRDFFILNKPVQQGLAFQNIFTKKWQRVARVILKIGFMIMVIIMPFRQSWSRYQTQSNTPDSSPIKSGIYEVKSFVRNNDTIPILYNDPMAWKDFVFEKNLTGSINTQDTLFSRRYHRGYFRYSLDSATQLMMLRPYRGDTLPLVVFNYRIPDDRTIQLWGEVRNDSIDMVLYRIDRHFQLTERQFHWISEANR